MRSTTIKWITLIVVVFIIGGALGFVGGESYQRYLFHKNQPPPRGPRNRGDFQKRLVENLKKDLGLSEEQTRNVTDILNQLDKKNDEGRRERMEAMRKEVDQQIEEVLDPQQKIKFLEFRKKLQKERDLREKRWSQDSTALSKYTTGKKEK